MHIITEFNQYDDIDNEIIDKLKLNDYYITLLTMFNESDKKHISEVINRRNSGWVNAYIKFILEMSAYDRHTRFDFKEKWPGGNGSKTALADLFSGITALHSEKCAMTSPAGRKSKKTLYWVEPDEKGEYSPEELQDLKSMYAATTKFPFTPLNYSDGVWTKKL